VALLGWAGAARARPFRLPDTSTQLVVVTTPAWDAVSGRLERFVRERGGPWRRVGDAVVVEVGAAGLGWGRGLLPDGERVGGPQKREGDRRAPAGVFRLLEMTGYAPSAPPGATLAYTPAEGRVCVDDPESPRYNQLLARAEAGPARSFEIMRRTDELYRLVIVVEHNRSPAVAGDGSCIFLHRSSPQHAPTVGCTAMDEAPLATLAAWLEAVRAPLLVQLPLTIYQARAATWRLPALTETR
jgi:D-alanyl-D-alanine dipeptidase